MNSVVTPDPLPVVEVRAEQHAIRYYLEHHVGEAEHFFSSTRGIAFRTDRLREERRHIPKAINDLAFLRVLLADQRLSARHLAGSEGRSMKGYSSEALTTVLGLSVGKYVVHTTGEAMGFCERKGLQGALDIAFKIVREHFDPILSVALQKDFDPEDSDEYLVLTIETTGSHERSLASYFNLMEDWSSTVEWPDSRMIRLDYVVKKQAEG